MIMEWLYHGSSNFWFWIIQWIIVEQMVQWDIQWIIPMLIMVHDGFSSHSISEYPIESLFLVDLH